MTKVTFKNADGTKQIECYVYDAELKLYNIGECNFPYSDGESFREIEEHNNLGYYARPAESFHFFEARELAESGKYAGILMENLS